MTRKIPVGATIARTYRFAFECFPITAGLIWLPWLIFYVGPICLLTASIANMPPASPVALTLPLLFDIAACVGMAMQMVAVCRQTSGVRTGPVYFYFTFDKATWRLALAYLGMIVAYIFLLFAIIIIGAYCYAGISILANTDSAPEKFGGAILGVLYAIAIPICLWGILYVMIRASFALAPACANGAGFGLARTWQLGKGNVWRAFIVFLSVTMPTFAVMFLVDFFVLLKPIAAITSEMVSHAQADGKNPSQIMQLALIHVAVSRWYILLPLGFIFNTLLFGLLAGAQSYAYRALTQDAA